MKIPAIGEVLVAAENAAPSDTQSRQVRTSVCRGMLMSIAPTEKKMVDATVTVSFPGIIRTGGTLRGGPLAEKTVIRIAALEFSLPSDTMNVVLCCPTSEIMGVQLKIPLT
jgi:hypothetical protein